MSAHTEFDLGSLIWVKGEIDQALEKARQSLAKYANQADAAELKFAQTHLHQVRGAVEMVGLSGASRFAEELEVAVGAVERGEADGSMLKLVSDAAQSLTQYLEALVNGSPDLALKLLPSYRRVRELRGEKHSSGADLFFPPLSATLPANLAAHKLDEAILPTYLKNARSRFEAGLLKWLKGDKHEGGQWMVQALFGVARTQSSNLQRGFWWTAAAMAEGSVDNRAKLDIDQKQLFARLNQQLKRLSESGGKVAERLFRDVLYAVATMETQSVQCAAVRRAYGLNALLPAGALEDDAHQLAAMQVARELKELINQTKDNWARVGGGSSDRLPTFRQQLAEVSKRAISLSIPAFDTLAATLQEVVAGMTAAPNESQALEVATALLLLENALVVFPERSSDFPAQATAMQARLKDGAANAPEVTLLDEVSRRAQERLLMAQVAQEIQTNLGQIEQTLDDFFRDPDTRNELLSTDAPIRQIRGALTILDERDAQVILDACADIVKRCQAEDYTAPAEELEFLAEAFSSLGFYIDALRREEADRGKLIAPWLHQIRGEAPDEIVPTEAEQIAAEFASEPEVELEPVVAASPAEVESAPANEPAPVAAPVVSTAVSEAAVDAELLEVYLEEAVEVLDNVNSHLAIIRDQPTNKEALTVIRRGFHTLKGSGRMVGLNQLGEVAWSVEQVMNKWLQDEKRASASLLQLVEQATAGFSIWVDQLKESGTAQVEATAIFILAEQLKNGQEPEHAAPATEAPQPAALEVEAEPPLDLGMVAEPEVETPIELALPELTSDAPALLELDAAPATEPAIELSAAPADEFALDFELDSPPAATEAETAEAAVLDFDLGEPEAAPLLPGSIELAHPEEEVEAPELVIGDITISKALFGIFLDEAYRHFATLNDAFIDFSTRGEVRPEFVHAAHTLCGIANTTGFTSLGELGYAIEQALLAYQKAGAEPAQGDYDTLSMAIDKVGVMLGQVGRYETPQDEPQTVAMLTALTNRLKDEAEPLLTLDSEPAPAEFDLTLDMAAPAETVVAAPALEGLTLDLDAAQPTEEVVLEAPAETAEPLDLLLEPEEIHLDLGDLSAPEISAATEAALLEETIEVAAASDADVLDLDISLDEADTAADALSATADSTDVLDLSLDELVLPEAALPEAALPEVALPEVSIDAPLAADEVEVEAELLDLEAELTADEDTPVALVVEELPGAELLSELSLDLTEATPELLGVADEPADLVEPVAELPAEDIDSPLVLDEIAEDVHAIPAAEAMLEAIPLAAVDEAIVLEAAEAEAPAVEEFVIPTAIFEPLVEETTLASAPTPAEQDGVGSVMHLATPDRLGDIHVKDELDEQLLPIFLEEMQELLPQLSADLRALRGEPNNTETHDSLKRVLHTLKGSARMAGAMRMGEATHNMETRLLNAGEHLSIALLDELDLDFDAINELQDRLINGEPEAAAEAEEQADIAAMVAASAASEASRVATAQPGQAARTAPALGLVDPDAGKSSIRVRSDLVDRLVNQAGEVSISRTRIESEMLALKRSLLDLTDNVARLRGQLREIEIQAESQMQSRMAHATDLPDFDPLEFDRFSRLQELTRFMAESVNDVATVQHNLLKNLDESSAALTQQARMTRDLQQELMRVRMVPFSSVSERLYRLVRQTGKETSKKVNLELRGGRAEIDRGVLEKMVSPFEHMLRNAIDHGLETPDQRLAKGKNEFGEIVVEARQEGNELVLVLRDDGAGLDIERIRQKGLEKGLIEAGGEYTDAHIMGLIFEAGFSTASAVTQLSGRGIGMDVVKSEIEDLGGRVEVTSEAGRGTTFTIHLPLTLAVTQAVLVKVAGKLYAIPSVMVEQVQELKVEPLNQLYQRHQAEWQGNVYPFHYLPRLLGDYDSQPEQKRYNTIMLLRSGISRIAVHVDELVKNQEVVVKNIGPQLVRVAGIAGATVLGNGEIVLIINPLALLQRRAEAPVADFDAAMAASAPAPEEILQIAPLVMVVDDSLTVRKITGRLLAREGYQVETAKDGVDALQKLQDIRPAVMLLDVEMPRMDGFELTRNLRLNADTRDIPIIMITSRTADKHKNYAFELGVNAFLGKPYQEDELLEHIRRLIGEEQPAA